MALDPASPRHPNTIVYKLHHPKSPCLQELTLGTTISSINSVATREDSLKFTELFNELADLEHARWGRWQRHLHSLGQRIRMLNVRPLDEEEVFVLPHSTIERWDTLIDTPYASLSPKSRASDLREVSEYWPVIADFVYDWLDEQGAETLAERWALEAKWPAANREELEILSADYRAPGQRVVLAHVENADGSTETMRGDLLA